MECRLYDVVDFTTHDIFVGEIVATWAHEDVLQDEKIDVTRVKPLLFDMGSIKYYALGEEIAPCWNVGKQLKKRSA